MQFSNLLKNGESHLSAMRFSFVLAVVISNFVVFGVWLGLSIANNEILSIPESVLVLYGLANGVAFGSKITQSNIESKSNDKPLESPPQILTERQ